MANPQLSTLRPVNPLLSQIAVSAIPSDAGLIADKVLEKIDVSGVGRTGSIHLENTRAFMGAPGVSTKRASNADRVNIDDHAPTITTYLAEIYGLESSFALEDMKDSLLPMDYEEREVKKVARAMYLDKESRIADLLFTAGNWGSYTSSLAALGNGSTGTKFDQVGATPLKDLDILKDIVRQNSHGIKPDTLVLGYGLARALARNPEVRGIFVQTSGAVSNNYLMSNDMVVEVLKSVLNIPNVFVGEARKDNGLKGLASSESQVWADDACFMGILRGSDAIQTVGGVRSMPLAAALIQYKQLQAGSYDSLNMIRRSVWAEEIYQGKILAQNYGFFLSDVI
jgi:hypothetical protein